MSIIFTNTKSMGATGSPDSPVEWKASLAIHNANFPQDLREQVEIGLMSVALPDGATSFSEARSALAEEFGLSVQGINWLADHYGQEPAFDQISLLRSFCALLLSVLRKGSGVLAEGASDAAAKISFQFPACLKMLRVSTNPDLAKGCRTNF